MPFRSLVNGSSTGKEGTGARLAGRRLAGTDAFFPTNVRESSKRPLSTAFKTLKPKPRTSGMGRLPPVSGCLYGIRL